MRQLIFLCLFLLLAWPARPQEQLNQPRVLLLNSYHKGFKWTDDITQAVSHELQRQVPVRLFVEYMDTKRHTTPEYLNCLARFFQVKYQHVNFDLILTSDNHAYSFLATYRDSFAQGVPVIFSGLNINDTLRANMPMATGIIEHVDYKKGLEMALRLHPETKQVYFIYDQSLTGKQIKKQLLLIQKQLPKDIDYYHLSNLDLPELKQKLKNVPDNSLVYLTIFFKDKKEIFIPVADFTRTVAQISKAPVYASWDFSLGYGVVGGLLTSGYYQGKEMAAMAAQYLQGTPIDDIPLHQHSPNKYMFDYQVMQRFNLSPQELPKESIIINQPQRLIDTYRAEFIISTITIVVLITIIVLLVSNIIKRRQAEEERLKEHQRLDRLVADRTEFLKNRIDDLTEALLNKNKLQQELVQYKEMLQAKNDEIERLRHADNTPGGTKPGNE